MGKPKSTKTNLTLKQRWAVATWLIENRVVSVSRETGRFEFGRVKIAAAVNEINEAKIEGLPNITGHLFKPAMDTYHDVCELNGQMPEIPPIESTVEYDKLKAENVGLKRDIEEITNRYTVVAKKNVEFAAAVEMLMDRLHKISQLVPAEAFGKKHKA